MGEPTSYGPDKVLVGFWTFLCSLPAIPWAYMLLRSPTSSSIASFLLTLILPLIPILFASRFRATFTPKSFVYRRWGPTVSVLYSDVDHIEVTNVTPVTKRAVGAFLVSKRGDRLPFWPKLFPRDAVKRFLDLSSDVRYPPEAATA